MKKLLISFLAAVMILSLAAAGCGKKPQARPEQNGQKKKEKVTYSSARTQREDYKILHKFMQDKSAGEGLQITWRDSQNDVLRQGEDVRKAGEEKAKALIVEPVDPVMLKSALQEVQKKGVKLLAVNALPPDLGVDGYIAPDYVRAGEMQSLQLLQEEEGRQVLDVLILHGSENDPVAADILTGNMKLLKDNPKIGRLSLAAVENWNPGEAFSLVKSYLQSPAPPQAILLHSPELTAGALEAIKEAGQEGKISTYGMGTSKSSLEAMKKGWHKGEIDFMPDQQAQIILEAAGKLAGGEPWEYERQVENGAHDIPARFTPLRSITKDNIALLEEKMKQLQKADQAAKKDQQGGGGQGKEPDEGQGDGSGGGNESESGSEGGEDSGKGGESGGQQGQGEKNKTVIKVKTKDGQTFEMNINGQVQSIEMEEQKSDQGGGQGGESGGQGGGGS